MDLVANVWMTQGPERDARAREPSSSALGSWENDGFWPHSPGAAPCGGRNLGDVWRLKAWSEQRRVAVPMPGSDCDIILPSAVSGDGVKTWWGGPPEKGNR